MAFLHDLNDLLDLIEDQIKFCLAHLLENNAQDLHFFDKFFQNGLLKMVEEYSCTPFKRITYAEALDVLKAVKKKQWQYVSLPESSLLTFSLII